MLGASCSFRTGCTAARLPACLRQTSGRVRPAGSSRSGGLCILARVARSRQPGRCRTRTRTLLRHVEGGRRPLQMLPVRCDQVKGEHKSGLSLCHTPKRHHKRYTRQNTEIKVRSILCAIKLERTQLKSSTHVLQSANILYSTLVCCSMNTLYEQYIHSNIDQIAEPQLLSERFISFRSFAARRNGLMGIIWFNSERGARWPQRARDRVAIAHMRHARCRHQTRIFHSYQCC